MISSPQTHHTAAGKVVLVQLSGDVDLVAGPRIQEQLASIVSNAALGLVLDLSGVRYIDSAGVRLLFQMGRRLEQNRQQLRLVVPQRGLVRRVLAFTSLESYIRIHPSADAALADFEGVSDQAGGHPEGRGGEMAP
ncbi:MAG TPA: STAS domain-containing protein [bacterium]|nr:STAS domain-containing protein [bacterium]